MRPAPASVLPRRTNVAGSGVGAGGASLETTKNCSRAPLSSEKFAVKITEAVPVNEVKSTVFRTKSETRCPSW